MDDLLDLLKGRIESLALFLDKPDVGQGPLWIPCHIACMFFKCKNWGKG